MSKKICGAFSKERIKQGKRYIPICRHHRKEAVEQGKRKGSIPDLLTISKDAQPIDRLCQFPPIKKVKEEVKEESEESKE